MTAHGRGPARSPFPLPGQGATTASVTRALVVAAHPDYEALALDELTRGGFQHQSRLVTSVGELRSLLAGVGVDDAWDIVLVIDTPDGPSSGEVLETLAGRLADTPVIYIGRSAPVDAPAGLASLRVVDLRSLAGAAADSLREIERHRGAQALRASETRFVTAFDSAPIGLALVRLDGRFLSVNPLFCSIARLDRDAIVATDAAAAADDDLLSCVLAAAARTASASELDEPLERRCIRADGTPVWIRVSASRASGDEGETLYLVVHVEDITSRRDAEDARERSEQLFRALFTSTTVCMVVIDREGLYVATNRAFDEFLGYDTGELIGKTFMAITHPDDVSASVAVRQAELDEDVGYRLEKRYVRKDGSVVWGELSGAPLWDDDERGLSIGAIIDISERKRAEEALAESLSLLESARGLAGIASWVARYATAAAEPELTWSPELFRLFGLPEETQGFTLAAASERTVEADRPKLAALIQAPLAGGRVDVELRIVRPDGEVRWLHAVADVSAGEGTSRRSLGVAIDITDAVAGRETRP